MDQEAKMESDTDAWVSKMDGRKVRLMGQRLRGFENARSIGVRDGRLSVHDRPVAETKKQIAGFDILECANLDEAIVVASKHPVAKVGLVEV